MTYGGNPGNFMLIKHAVAGEALIRINEPFKAAVKGLNLKVFAKLNMPSLALGTTFTSNNSFLASMSGYVVNSNGQIKNSVWEQGKTAGMTKGQPALYTINKMPLYEPSVGVRQFDFTVAVLSEKVTRPLIGVPDKTIDILKALAWPET